MDTNDLIAQLDAWLMQAGEAGDPGFVTTGGSSLRTLAALREAGARTKHCVAIFSYGFREADEAFGANDCSFTAITGFDALLEASGHLDAAAHTQLRRWHDDPHAWGP